MTNDDGINAPGILALANVARQFGEVKLAAPDSERSACAHALTMREPLRASHVSIDGMEGYCINGYPADCVNIGIYLGWPDGCDLVLSGFNNGPNLGFDVTYSGTVAGAMEGTIKGIRSISLSMARFVDDAPLHYETGAQWLREEWEMLVSLPFEPLVFLNVNVPAIAYPEIEGHRYVGMGKQIYKEQVEARIDPYGRPYYWQGGTVVMAARPQDTDVEAVSRGFVAITPISLDWTDHGVLRRMRETRLPFEPVH